MGVEVAMGTEPGMGTGKGTGKRTGKGTKKGTWTGTWVVGGGKWEVGGGGEETEDGQWEGEREWELEGGEERAFYHLSKHVHNVPILYLKCTEYALSAFYFHEKYRKCISAVEQKSYCTGRKTYR
jgi:hypothetical protein